MENDREASLVKEVELLRAQVMVLSNQVYDAHVQIRRIQDMYLLGVYRFARPALTKDTVRDIQQKKRPRSLTTHQARRT